MQRRFRLFIRSGMYGTMRPWLTLANHTNTIRRMEQCQEDAPTRTRARGRSDKDASEKEILIAGAIPIAAAILVTGFLHRAQLRNMLIIIMAAALRLLRKIIYDAAQSWSEVKNKADDG